MKTDAWCIRLQAILARLMIAACATAPFGPASTLTVTTIPPAAVTTAQTPTRVLPTNTLLPSPTRTPVATPTPAATATSTPAGLALPPTRRGAGLVFDEARGQLVLFGGIGIAPQGVFSDTWLYDGVNWVEGHPAVAPPARDSASMVYDPGSQTVVLFGGVNVEGQPLGDTWLWNGTDWSEPKLATAPSPRNDASLVYDAKHHQVLLFGGEGAVPGSDRATTGLNDTWAWNGKAWIELFPPTSPSKRSQASMAYDATRQNVVLIGGNLPAGDTWRWDGRTWHEQQLAVLPSPRNQAAMAYDAYHQQVVLFGGYAVARGLTDTWIWNGATWAPVTSQPTFSGTALESHLVSDATRLELLLFLITGGKFTWTTSIWVWSGTGWKQSS